MVGEIQKGVDSIESQEAEEKGCQKLSNEIAIQGADETILEPADCRKEADEAENDRAQRMSHRIGIRKTSQVVIDRFLFHWPQNSRQSRTDHRQDDHR